MSPFFEVSLEIHAKKGVVSPAANTLNNAREAILADIFGETVDQANVEFQSIGRLISFCVECEDLEQALAQVHKMIPESQISNPVIERVTSLSIKERDAF